MKRTILTASVLAATPVVANETFTADQLHRFCEESAEFCVGFAAGIINGIGIGKWDIAPVICLPKAFMTFGQPMDVITKYLREHPEQRHNPATAVVVMAI
jgi:hypothetical protein